MSFRTVIRRTPFPMIQSQNVAAMMVRIQLSRYGSELYTPFYVYNKTHGIVKEL